MVKKIAYTLEYTVRSSPQIVFEFLSPAFGLQDWLSDEVNLRDNIFSFFCDQSSEQAQIVQNILYELVRYHWKGAPDTEYFEFRVKRSEVTNETVLLITDFAPE